MLQWYSEGGRRQFPKEPVTAYILAKAKWLRQCPEVFEEARYLPIVIRGLGSSELRAVLSRYAPVTIAGLLEAENEIEQYQPVPSAFLRQSNTAPVARAAPASPVVPAYDRPGGWPAAQAPAPTVEPQLDRGQERALVPIEPAQQPYRIPRLLRDIQCFVCGNFGHLRQYCPERPPGNGRAGPAGQARQ